MNIVSNFLRMGDPVPLLILLISIAVIVLAVFIANKKINDRILAESPKIKALTALNSKMEFHKVETFFRVRKHYDNKSNYNRIEPSYLMTAEIRGQIYFYADVVKKLKENRSLYEEYKESANKIKDNVVTDLTDLKFRILKWLYRWRENKLFDKTVLMPNIDCSFEVLMTYSSPKGKVNLSKEKCYNFNDVYTCLESVSRTYLDKETNKRLALVERGMLTDSMRYDVLRRDGFRCVLCGASADEGARLHVDHIVPVSKGGKSEYDNLRTLCERCNIGKSNKIESEVANEDKKTVQDKEDVCPYCGGKLVLRRGSRGEFYGCSNYPRCRFTKNV